MKEKSIKSIVITMIAIMIFLLMNVAISSAVSKKTYKLPYKTVSESGDYAEKFEYKNGKIKYSTPGYLYNFTEIFTYKSKNKYSVHVHDNDLNVDRNVRIRSKDGRVILEKGRHINGDKYIEKFYYKKGKLYKITNATYFSNDEYLKSRKAVTKCKTDKYGNIKKRISVIKTTYNNNKVERVKDKRIYNRTYKGSKLKEYSYKEYMWSGKEKKWVFCSEDTRKIAYKKVRLTIKQYKKYKPIVDYIIRYKYK